MVNPQLGQDANGGAQSARPRRSFSVSNTNRVVFYGFLGLRVRDRVWTARFAFELAAQLAAESASATGAPATTSRPAAAATFTTGGPTIAACAATAGATTAAAAASGASTATAASSRASTASGTPGAAYAAAGPARRFCFGESAR